MFQTTTPCDNAAGCEAERCDPFLLFILKLASRRTFIYLFSNYVVTNFFIFKLRWDARRAGSKPESPVPQRHSVPDCPANQRNCATGSLWRCDHVAGGWATGRSPQSPSAPTARGRFC